MSRIFLSHSSGDDFEAVALRDWLASEGWQDVFLDLDPVRGIEAGQRWERRLHEAASRCEAVVFLVSGNWLASDWCLKEYTVARRLNKKLFAVLVDPAKPIHTLPAALTDTWQVVDLAGGQDMQLFCAVRPSSQEEKHVGFSRDGLTRLKRGLQKAGLDPRFFAWPKEGDPHRAPYRGLRPFEASDAGIFFGRDAPIVEATDRLRGLGIGAPPRLLVILGASGAGKSSFLRAGLLPRLARDDTHFVAMPPIRPERAALTGENGLLRTLEMACPARTRADLRAAMQAGASGLRPILAELVYQTFRQTLAEDGATRRPSIVIAIDQAEELFRAEGSEEGQALLELVRDLTASDDPVAVIVIFAIRSDSYDELEHAKALEGARQDTIPLLPMPRGAYKEVIEGPARRVSEAGSKLAIEPQLTEHLLADIEAGSGSDALPLLAFTLEQLYLEYYRSGVLRLADYEAIGRLGGAINRAIERAFIRADADARIPRERAAREALLRRGLIPWLCGIDPDTKSPRRNIARLTDIPVEAAPLINLLVEERLLSTDQQRDQNPGAEGYTTTIEPTHEALLRQWGLLEGWLAEDFGLLATLEGLKRGARDWDANCRDEAWLAHHAQRLSEVQGLYERPDIAARLDIVDLAYVAACREREDDGLRESQRRQQERIEEQARRLLDAQRLAIANRLTADRTRIGLAVALLFGIAAMLFGLFAYREKGAADHQAQEARVQRVAADRAAAEAERQQDRAEAASKTAVIRSDEAISNQVAALAALSKASTASDPVRAVKLALAAWPRSIDDLTPKMNVTLDALSESISLMNERKIYTGFGSGVIGFEFSSDGTQMIALEESGLVEIRSSRSLQPPIFVKDTTPIRSAHISADGRMLMTLGSDQRVSLWDIRSDRKTNILVDRHLKSAIFSPDGMRILTLSDRGAALWNTRTCSLMFFLQTSKMAENAEFSPDGRLIATATERDIDIWSTETGNKIKTIHTDLLISQILFFNDKKIIARQNIADDGGGLIYVFDISSGSKLFSVAPGNSYGISVSAETERIASIDQDNSVSVFDANNGDPISHLRGHSDEINMALFSSDGRTILTSSKDKTAALWDVESGRLISRMSGHQDDVPVGVFTPDRKSVVTGSLDRTIRVWARTSNPQGYPLAANFNPWVDSVDFNAETKEVVAFAANTIYIMNFDLNRVIRKIPLSADKVAFSRDLKHAVTDDGRVVNLNDGSLSINIDYSHSSEHPKLTSLAYVNDKDVLGVDASGDLKLWDAGTGDVKKSIPLPQSTLAAALSPTGDKEAVISTDGTLKILNKDGTIIIISRKIQADAISDRTEIAFLGQDRLIVRIGENLFVWDLDTNRPLTKLYVGEVAVGGFSAHENISKVLAGTNYGTVEWVDLGDLGTGNLFQVACNWLPEKGLSDIAAHYGIKKLNPICIGQIPLPTFHTAQ